MGVNSFCDTPICGYTAKTANIYQPHCTRYNDIINSHLFQGKDISQVTSGYYDCGKIRPPIRTRSYGLLVK